MKYIVKESIDLSKVITEVQNSKAGAVVLFSGEVRNYSKDKSVDHLFYEAYEVLALALIEEIINDAKQKWNLHNAVCIHRIGKLMIGESAVAVATSSTHRSEAYEANRYIIDRVKHEVPIWKHEFFSDGTSEWGGNCNCKKKSVPIDIKSRH